MSPAEETGTVGDPQDAAAQPALLYVRCQTQQNPPQGAARACATAYPMTAAERLRNSPSRLKRTAPRPPLLMVATSPAYPIFTIAPMRIITYN